MPKSRTGLIAMVIVSAAIIFAFMANSGAALQQSTGNYTYDLLGSACYMECIQLKPAKAGQQSKPKKAKPACDSVCVEKRTFNNIVRHADHSLIVAGHDTSPLRRELRGIVMAAKENGVSPFFLLAIAGKESTFGRNACGGNAWGWNSCRSYNFRNFTEGAKTVAHNVRLNYFQKWNKRDVYSFGNTYCACGAHWADSVSYFMRHIFKAGAGMYWRDAVKAIN